LIHNVVKFAVIDQHDRCEAGCWGRFYVQGFQSVLAIPVFLPCNSPSKYGPSYQQSFISGKRPPRVVNIHWKIKV